MPIKELPREEVEGRLSLYLASRVGEMLRLKGEGHRLAITALPPGLLIRLCLHLRADKTLPPGTQAVLVADPPRESHEVSPTKLIELRNDEARVKVLVACIPTTYRSYAEDSYGQHNFEFLDPLVLLSRYRDHLRDRVEQEGYPGIRLILKHARNKEVERQIRYLLSVLESGCTSETLGALLYLLDLAPDLALDLNDLDRRLRDNQDKTAALAEPLTPIIEKVKDLRLRDRSIQWELIKLLDRHGPARVEDWGREIVERALAEKKRERRLSYDNWVTEDAPEGDYAISLLPLAKTNPDAVDRAGEVNIPLNGKVRVKWTFETTRPADLHHFAMYGMREDVELFRSGTIGANRRTVTLNLAGKAVDEGHCVIRLDAMSPDGRLLAYAESEPFWLIAEDAPIEPPASAPEPRYGLQVFCIPEAYVRARVRVREGVKRPLAPEEIRWLARRKGGPLTTLRIKFGRTTVYHVELSPLLREFELHALRSPLEVGIWSVKREEGGFAFECDPLDGDLLPEGTARNFYDKRRALFAALAGQQPSGAEPQGMFETVVETADLIPLQESVLAYIEAYLAALAHAAQAPDLRVIIRLLNIDCIRDELGILLSPLHPLKLLWFLQYQRLLQQLLLEFDEGRKIPPRFDESNLRLFTSLNFPLFVPALDGKLLVNTGQVGLLWSAFAEEPERYRNAVGGLARRLEMAPGELEHAGIGGEVLSRRVRRYLQLHPYVRHLKINVANPGDGSSILDTVRVIEAEMGARDFRYDLKFFARKDVISLAEAFDRLMLEEDERKRKEGDDELVEIRGNLLVPKLVYAKHALEDLLSLDGNAMDGHLFFIIDHYRLRVGAVPEPPAASGSFLGGLLNDFTSRFVIEAETAKWIHTVVPQERAEHPSLQPLLPTIERALREYMRGASLLAGGPREGWPCLMVEIGDEERRLITNAHALCEWVVTVDKHFDVDFLDHPTSPFCEYYLVDYSPTLREGIGHKLIVSTASVIEIHRAVAEQLKGLRLPTEATSEVVALLQAISGRLAMRVLSAKSFAREALSIVLLWQRLKREGTLREAVFIPVDAHLDLFEAMRAGDEGEGQRTDVLLVTLDPTARLLKVRLVEAKLRAALGIAELIGLKGAIAAQLKQTEQTLSDGLERPESLSRINHFLFRKAFWEVVSFYIERAKRHGILTNQAAARLGEALTALRAGEFGLSFQKEGYVFDLSRTGFYQEVLLPDGIQLFYLGKDEILALLSSVGLEEEAPAEPEPPIGPGAGTTLVKAVTPEPAPSSTEILDQRPTEPAQRPPEVRVHLGRDFISQEDVFWEPHRSEPRRLTNPHVLIVGTSGAGKTQTTMAFLHELWRAQVPSLILDFHGEYADPKADRFRAHTSARVVDALQGIPINPLEVPFDAYGRPYNYRRMIWEVSEILGKIFRLGLQQQRALKRAIEKAYQHAGFTSDENTWTRRPPAFSRIRDLLHGDEAAGGAVVTTLLSRIDVLFDIEVFSERADYVFEDLIRNVTVVDLSRLFNDEHRLVVARFFLQKVYSSMLLQGETQRLRLMVVVDEAHKLSYDETLVKLIKEARKYGVGILLSSQEPSDFPTTALELPGTKIFLQQGPRGARAVVEHLERADSRTRARIEAELQSLEVGHAFLKSDHFVPYKKAIIEFFYARV